MVVQAPLVSRLPRVYSLKGVVIGATPLCLGTEEKREPRIVLVAVILGVSEYLCVTILRYILFFETAKLLEMPTDIMCS